MIEQAETSKPLGLITPLSRNHAQEYQEATLKNVHKINVSPHSLQEIFDLPRNHNSLVWLRGRKCEGLGTGQELIGGKCVKSLIH